MSNAFDSFVSSVAEEVANNIDISEIESTVADQVVSDLDYSMIASEVDISDLADEVSATVSGDICWGDLVRDEVLQNYDVPGLVKQIVENGQEEIENLQRKEQYLTMEVRQLTSRLEKLEKAESKKPWLDRIKFW